ncbi:hypothetical protein [Ornithinibacillus scapharcae]|uniref:hypothetical protein n=1 Tax=Ornithinibacillus scapharcae TaxID=1147159 RepID=UPI000225AB45|nr:hypothetical protein [Ornithinibacillus scapharcae]
MYQFKLFNVSEIDQLKQELEEYKQELAFINSNNKPIKYSELRQDIYHLERKYSMVKGELKRMEMQYEEHINRYENQAQHINSRINSIDASINQLKQDISYIKDEVKGLPFQELINKIDQVIEHTDANLSKVKSSIANQDYTFSQIKEQLTPKEISQKSQNASPQSEYRRVQNILQSITTAKGAPLQNNKTIRNRPVPTTRAGMNKVSYHSNSNVGNNTVSVTQGGKSFINSQFEFNKNIITKRPSPPRKQEVIKEQEIIKEQKEQNNVTPRPNIPETVEAPTVQSNPTEKVEPEIVVENPKTEIPSVTNTMKANQTDLTPVQPEKFNTDEERENKPSQETVKNESSKRSSFFSFFKTK